MKRSEIEAAVTAYNATDPDLLLPPEAARLLGVMFRRSDVCQRTVDNLAAETTDTVRTVVRLLRLLAATGFLSKEQRAGAVANTYRLTLPPRRQP
jgi:hypothetical protein